MVGACATRRPTLQLTSTPRREPVRASTTAIVESRGGEPRLSTPGRPAAVHLRSGGTRVHQAGLQLATRTVGMGPHGRSPVAAVCPSAATVAADRRGSKSCLCAAHALSPRQRHLVQQPLPVGIRRSAHELAFNINPPVLIEARVAGTDQVTSTVCACHGQGSVQRTGVPRQVAEDLCHYGEGADHLRLLVRQHD